MSFLPEPSLNPETLVPEEAFYFPARVPVTWPHSGRHLVLRTLLYFPNQATQRSFVSFTGNVKAKYSKTECIVGYHEGKDKKMQVSRQQQGRNTKESCSSSNVTSSTEVMDNEQYSPNSDSDSGSDSPNSDVIPQLTYPQGYAHLILKRRKLTREVK